MNQTKLFIKKQYNFCQLFTKWSFISLKNNFQNFPTENMTEWLWLNLFPKVPRTWWPLNSPKNHQKIKNLLILNLQMKYLMIYKFKFWWNIENFINQNCQDCPSVDFQGIWLQQQNNLKWVERKPKPLLVSLFEFPKLTILTSTALFTSHAIRFDFNAYEFSIQPLYCQADKNHLI